MKTYIAIGYFKHDKAKNMKSIIEECRTKTEMIQDCKGNGFVAHLILSDEQMYELAEMDEVDLVKTIVTLMHYTKKVWDVADYLYQHRNNIKENI